MQKLLKTILSRFVKPSALVHALPEAVDYKQTYNIKSNSELVIGEEARLFIENKASNHLRESRIEEFYKTVKAYFLSLADYLKKWLPLAEPLLRHAEIVDLDMQLEAKSESLRFFLTRFPCLLPEGATTDLIIEQFTYYQCTDVSSCRSEDDRVDAVWKKIGELDDGHLHELSLVMRGILTIPHGSAHCERVFSCVKKNRTTQRSSLAESTVESLLVLKSGPCDTMEAVKNLSEDSLRRLKSAYSRSLKK